VTSSPAAIVVPLLKPEKDAVTTLLRSTAETLLTVNEPATAINRNSNKLKTDGVGIDALEIVAEAEYGRDNLVLPLQSCSSGCGVSVVNCFCSPKLFPTVFDANALTK
jgi:hypothetical protein